MPIQECEKNGVKGHKWGKSGKCYTGPYSRALALNTAHDHVCSVGSVFLRGLCG